MPKRIQHFGSGAILSALTIFVFTGVIGWIGQQSVKIPYMEEKLSNVKSIVDEIKGTRSDIKMLSQKIESYSRESNMAYQQILKKQNSTSIDIRELKKYVDTINERVHSNEYKLGEKNGN